MINLPRRIVIASSGLGHVARGIEAWAADLATALAERGLPVTLCKGGGVAEREFEHVIPCCRRESASTRRLLRLLPRRLTWRFGLGSAYDIEQLTFSAGLIRFLRRRRADILHVQDPLVALLGQRARGLGLIPARTILAHGTEESLKFLRRIEFLQHLAPWHMEQARDAGVWNPRWTAIPNFIDTDQFAPGRAPELRTELGIPPDAAVVLSVAALKRHHKRIDYLIDEFARLRAAAPDLPAFLVLAGGHEEETEALVAAGRGLLGDRVRFLVRFPRSRMPDLYRTADLFCLGSLLEMMPIALLEATASGLPCLVNRQPVMEWMVGGGGPSIDMAAPGALAAALERLLREPAERARLGRRARAHCVEHFSRGAVIDQILAYYGTVAGEPAGPRAACEVPICA
ncbi:MAG: glycosyltransferase family 4 protein [Gemmataceae bacterium]